ncbi:MAG: hypothetical protein U9Q30_05230, partial [Campylobacterota bacterium]|nr:hypothetical protein [Campylobacterota bacterium]
MSYSNWLDTHSLKHKNIINKLSHLTDEEIIKYFDYENMKLKEKEFCILYKDNRKCHDIEKLNCYLCGCPNFRVDKTKSFCSINSKYGDKIVLKDFTHQDCSKCKIPHSVPYIKKNFNKNWSSI